MAGTEWQSIYHLQEIIIACFVRNKREKVPATKSCGIFFAFQPEICGADNRIHVIILL